MKTVAVLLASWWFFHEPMTPRKLLGMTLAVAGMAAYGHSMANKNGGSTAKRVEDEADVCVRLIKSGKKA
jgi:hypothetical protein